MTPAFFGDGLTEMIDHDPRLQVIGTASNGREALRKTLELKPDVITMDYEMPMMDGITAVREIMAEQPTPILMFSSLTYEGARVTLDSLDAGAVDYLPKNFDEISRNAVELKNKLAERINMVATIANGSRHLRRSVAAPVRASRQPVRGEAPVRAAEAPLAERFPAPKRKAYSLVAIGTSTGGPVALQHVLTQLPANFPSPIVLDSAHAGDVHRRICRASEQSVQDRRQGSGRRRHAASRTRPAGARRQAVDDRQGAAW